MLKKTTRGSWIAKHDPVTLPPEVWAHIYTFVQRTRHRQVMQEIIPAYWHRISEQEKKGKLRLLWQLEASGRYPSRRFTMRDSFYAVDRELDSLGVARPLEDSLYPNTYHETKHQKLHYFVSSILPHKRRAVYPGVTINKHTTCLACPISSFKPEPIAHRAPIIPDMDDYDVALQSTLYQSLCTAPDEQPVHLPSNRAQIKFLKLLSNMESNNITSAANTILKNYEQGAERCIQDERAARSSWLSNSANMESRVKEQREN